MVYLWLKANVFVLLDSEYPWEKTWLSNLGSPTEGLGTMQIYKTLFLYFSPVLWAHLSHASCMYVCVWWRGEEGDGRGNPQAVDIIERFREYPVPGHPAICSVVCSVAVLSSVGEVWQTFYPARPHAGPASDPCMKVVSLEISPVRLPSILCSLQSHSCM